MKRIGALLLLAALAAAQEPRLVAQLGQPQVHAVSFSPDGRWVLAGGVLYEYSSGLEVRNLQANVTTLAPDSRHALTADFDGSLRLWEIRNGAEVQRCAGHDGTYVRSVAVSPDGTQALSGAWDGTARLWDLATGREIRRFPHGDVDVAVGNINAGVNAVAFARNGKRILTGCGKRVAILWDTGGKEIRRFEGHTKEVLAVAFSPREKRIVTGGQDGQVIVWKANGGELLRLPHGHPVGAVAFSHDGKRIATGSIDRAARVWDAATGKLLHALEAHTRHVLAVAFSPDDRHVLTGGQDGAAILWERETGREVRRYGGRADAAWAIAFSPHGDRLAFGTFTSNAILWDLAEGREVRRFPGHTASVQGIDFSPDGRFLLTGSYDGTATVWNRTTGEKIRTYKCGDHVHGALFAAGGRQFVVNSGGIVFRDRESGDEIARFLPREGFNISGFRVARDGRLVLVPESGIPKTKDDIPEGFVVLRDVGSGKELLRFRQPVPVYEADIAPDGRRVLVGAYDGDVVILNAETGKELHRLEHDGQIVGCRLSPDGRFALVATGVAVTRLYDTETGERKWERKHKVWDHSHVFSQDGRWIASTNAGSVLLRNAATGAEMCRLTSFRDGSWAVVDPDGRYDASNGGDLTGVHWVVGDEVVELVQTKERYYEPRLLAKVLGFNKEPLREVAHFTKAELHPRVEIDPPTAREQRLLLRLTNRGAGIGRVEVRINGKEITADARRPGMDPDATSMRIAVPLGNDLRIRPGEVNRIGVRVFNREGYLCNRGVTVNYMAPGKKRTAPPEVWAVVAGVGDYQGDTLKLRYAAKDAANFGQALKTAASRLFQARRVHLRLLQDPDRKSLVAALEALRRSKPGDVLVVYLAGHGKNHQGEFYFLTQEARSADLTDPAVRAQAALSSDELTQLINKAPAAEKQVLILDTCAAGRFIDNLTETREVPSSQIRALQRLKDRTGVHILAGCAADRVSYEASRYGQGLLTYSLLLGMRGGALKEDDLVDVATLFHFAADRVPQLAERIGGIQRPVIATPRAGQSFAIGRLTPADRKKIPLRQALPLFLRSNFQDEEQLADRLELANAVDRRLRGEAAQGDKARLAFVDASAFPGGYRITGRYRVTGEDVTVSAVLFQSGAGNKPFTVTGKTKNLVALAKKLVDRARRDLK